LDGILARTEAPPDGNGEALDGQADGENGQSRGGLRATRPRRPKNRLKPGEKPRGCKLNIPQSVFDRLQQTAIKRRTTMSVLAGEILDRNLPYFDVKQLDKPPTE
jgi:hypothetical protein